MKGQKEVQRLEALRVHDIAPLLEGFGIVIDGGAHVGSWTVELSKIFWKVLAFEPCPESYEMLVENTGEMANVIPYDAALLDAVTTVDVVQPKPKRTTLTARFVKPNPAGDIRAVTIDSLNLPSCDLIKLDLEGAEMAALLGGANTIQQYRPFLVIEFNNLLSRFGHSEEQLLALLRMWGYVEAYRDGVDRGFKHKSKGETK